MGQFIIAPTDRNDAVDGQIRRLSAHGFETGLDVTVGTHRLVVHKPLNGAPVNIARFENGDFALHTGSLIFEGTAGPQALERLYQAFDPALPLPGNLYGHFALIVAKAGTLSLTTDPAGSHHVYHDTGQQIFSSSFVAVAEIVGATTPDVDGVYEYVWNGSTFGTKTVLEDVRLLPAPAMVTLGENVTIAPAAPLADALRGAPERSLEDAAATHVASLRQIFSAYRSLAPRPFRTALSGGFDSRLILALLLDAGIDPDLFVFGPPESDDVRCAMAIAAGENLSLRHVDKQTRPLPAPEAFAAQVARDFYVFDGLKYDGLFDSGADYEDRMERERGDGIVLNGSVGEIYRNFFYVPDRPMRLEDLVATFFSRYAPGATTEAFSPARYTETLVREMQAALGTTETRVDRPGIEALYPLFRGRFWSARDASINQRFGWMLYPFLEPAAIVGTPTEPMAWKQHGRLEAEMIRQINPRLAAYDSAYGGPFDRPLPLAYRLKSLFTQSQPPGLRRLTYRLRKHDGRASDPVLSDAYLKRVMDVSAPYMSRYFRLDRLSEAAAFNRAMTLEYLLQRLAG